MRPANHVFGPLVGVSRCQTCANPEGNRLGEELSTEVKLALEARWRHHVLHAHENDFDSRRLTSQKCYVLPMFPYPSGALHMGHVRVYAISDAMARFHRMNGKQVIHPMGWDAFGLPAENAARERGLEPAAWTKTNIAHMRRQLRQLGCGFDWRREVSTADPRYFRWTQWLFVRLVRSGMAYRKAALALWDPVDETVLAEEQVDAEGRAWRSGALVERRVLSQWFVRTRAFAHSLRCGLDDPQLENWKDVRALQAHWLGECEGCSLEMPLIGGGEGERLTAWTAMPSGAGASRFVAVPPDSALALLHPGEWTGGGEGTEVPLWRELPVRACSPFSSSPLPVLVLGGEWGPEEARLGLPRACAADAAIAKAASLPPAAEEAKAPPLDWSALEAVGAHRCSARLRDWLVSRQRSWGTPLPAVLCSACGPQPVPEEQLPILTAPPKSDAEAYSSWLNTTCPRCGGTAHRETDTMDTFVDSSWYYLRFLDPHNEQEPFSQEAAVQMPVDLYIGGKEHAVLHLYYARFMQHFLHSQGLVPCREPFRRLLPQGMVMGQAFCLKSSGRYLPASEVDTSGKEPVERATGLPVEALWEKMSKSKFNGVDPQSLLEEYGCDATRLFMLADVAPMSHRHWSSGTFGGVLKWQRRIWLTLQKLLSLRQALARGDESPLGPPMDPKRFQQEENKLKDSRNYYVMGVTFHFAETQQLSVAISKMQGLTNSLRRAPPWVMAQGLEFEKALAAQIVLLTPLAPHFACELWEAFVQAPAHVCTGDLRANDESKMERWGSNALNQPWPHVDADYQLPLTVKVTGREPHIIKLPRTELDALTEAEAVRLALEDPNLQKYVEQSGVHHTSLWLLKSCAAELRIQLHRKKATSKDEDSSSKAEQQKSKARATKG